MTVNSLGRGDMFTIPGDDAQYHYSGDGTATMTKIVELDASQEVILIGKSFAEAQAESLAMGPFHFMKKL